MMDLTTYISAESLVVIPMLYVIGMMLKGTNKVSDNYIPLILVIIGVACCVGINGFNVNSFIQGVLVTGVAVYTNQLIKQVSKSNPDTTKTDDTAK
jgi:hypothetical protein